MVGTDHSSIEGMMKSGHPRPAWTPPVCPPCFLRLGGPPLEAGGGTLGPQAGQGQGVVIVGGVLLQWGTAGGGQEAAAAGQWEAEQV